MWQYNYTDELYHHGVLGMKWGVRRSQAQLLKGAKAKRKANLEKAGNDEVKRAVAKAKYKQEKKSIKANTKRKIEEIYNTPEGIRARKVQKAAKKGAAITAGILGTYGAVVAAETLARRYFVGELLGAFADGLK